MTDRELKLRNLLVEEGIFSPREKLSVSIAEHKGEVKRKSDTRSRRYFVAKDSTTLYAVKYLPSSWNFSPDTIIETMKRYQKLETVKVPGIAGVVKSGDGVFIVEEFLRDAVTLESLIASGSIATNQAAVLLRELFSELYAKGKRTTSDFFASERAAYLNGLRSFIREGAFSETMLAYVGKVIDEHTSEFRSILSTGDIIDRNIVYAHGAWHLVDFEYSHETIFGFKDAYRNILYTNWARYFSLADLYPPLGKFPADVAVMLSLAWEYDFQGKVLDEESLEPTRRHLRYLFWNAVEPSILYKLDRRVGEVEGLLASRDEELQRVRKDVADNRSKDEELSRLHGHIKHLDFIISERDKKIADLDQTVTQRRDEITNLNSQLVTQQSLLVGNERRLNDVMQMLSVKDNALREQVEAHAKLVRETNEKNVVLARTHDSLSKLQAEHVNIVNELTKQRESTSKLASDFQSKENVFQQQMQLLTQEKEEIIRVRDERIVQVESWGNSIQKQLQYKSAAVLLQENTISDLSNRVKDAESRAAEKDAALQRKSAEYIFIKSTLSYSLGKILTFPFFIIYKIILAVVKVFDNAVGATFWPRGTKRHMVVDAFMNLPQTIATSTYLIRMHGLGGLLNGIGQKWDGGESHVLHKQFHAPAAPVPMKNMITPVIPREEVEMIDAGVSVVIPVLNEADNLTKLLPVLTNQKGIKTIEIIVVDSGSTDDSLAIAEANGAKVLRMPPEKFSHSGSRNMGAEQAMQEHLLFMTADALPVSEIWLNQMFSFMMKEGADAVSCMESPRIDADLFPQVENWYHYRVILGLNGEDRISKKPENDDPVKLRMNAQLSDVSCLMKRSTFQKYTFRYDYAEDLDLGIRLLNDGGKIGLMSSTRVIHSHTRPAYYYMKRGYIDKMTLSQMLHERFEDTHVDFPRFSQDIMFTYDALRKLQFSTLKGMQKPVPVEEFITEFKQRFQPLMSGPYPAKVQISDAYLDKQTVIFLKNFYSAFFKENSKTTYDGILMDGIRVFADIAFEYLRMTNELIDSTRIQDFEQLVYKYYANLTGRYLGVCYLKTPEEQRKRLQSIHAELFDGKILWNEKAPVTQKQQSSKPKK